MLKAAGLNAAKFGGRTHQSKNRSAWRVFHQDRLFGYILQQVVILGVAVSGRANAASGYQLTDQLAEVGLLPSSDFRAKIRDQWHEWLHRKGEGIPGLALVLLVAGSTGEDWAGS